MSQTQRRPVSAVTAVTVMARLTLRRTLRTGGMWWAAGIAFLPVLLAAALMGRHRADLGAGPERWREMFYVLLGLLAIIPALLLGPAIADEKDDKTMTYLWSRPIGRWTVLAGKMLTLVPICALVIGVALAATFQITWGGGSQQALAHAAGAMALGCLATGSMAAALGTLAPRHPMAFAVMYMTIFDVPLGLLPMKLQELSITHQVTQLAQVPDRPHPAAGALLWLGGMTAAWLAVAVWRIRRLE